MRFKNKILVIAFLLAITIFPCKHIYANISTQKINWCDWSCTALHSHSYYSNIFNNIQDKARESNIDNQSFKIDRNSLIENKDVNNCFILFFLTTIYNSNAKLRSSRNVRRVHKNSKNNKTFTEYINKPKSNERYKNLILVMPECFNESMYEMSLRVREKLWREIVAKQSSLHSLITTRLTYPETNQKYHTFFIKSSVLYSNNFIPIRVILNLKKVNRELSQTINI